MKEEKGRDRGEDIARKRHIETESGLAEKISIDFLKNNDVTPESLINKTDERNRKKNGEENKIK